MKRSIVILVMLLPVILYMTACNSTYSPRRKGYFKVDLPEKKYVLYDRPGYPYTFEYPVYANVTKDSSFFGEETENPWWINIDLPQFNGRIYISYKEIGRNNFDSLVGDAWKLAYRKHTEKATRIRDSFMNTPNGVEGMYWSLGGNTATANQFFLTDSTKHFLRGALYFDAAPNEDSLKIVNDFLKQDLQHLINTLKWR
jgi:gliding motility-associated lipoprotein GldD